MGSLKRLCISGLRSLRLGTLNISRKEETFKLYRVMYWIWRENGV
jgi:hypothetical protein